MPGIVKIKICKRCNKAYPMVGKQTVCRKCAQQVHKQASKNWWAKQAAGIRKKYDAPGGEDKREYKRSLGLTFEFTGGKWHWVAKNGLTNGPFDTLGAARKDANKAL